MAVRALARVNLAAIERNAARLRARVDGARLCAVVKADGYGHGAAHSAQAARSGGAEWLAVATAPEAAALREAEIGGPLLVMGALSSEELPVALEASADVVAWSEPFVDEVTSWARGRGREARIHVKLDTGMGRLGTREVPEAMAVAERVRAGAPDTVLAGAMTHFATADDDPEFMSEQLSAFRSFVVQLRAVQPDLLAHAANSAGTLRGPEAQLDMVRCGIALYGCDPMHQDPAAHGLEPALELSSWVAAVKRAQPGQSTGYGRKFIAERPTWIATAPIGYGDGVRRALGNNCDALIGGHRYPVVGAVSMDNITIDVGPQPRVAVGEPVTLIGSDGTERQTAEDLAHRADTIAYEIVCGVSARVPRLYHRDGVPA